MQAALAGGGADDAAALVQVPLESIVGSDSGAALHAVRHAIELEHKVVSARLAAVSAGGAQQQQLQQQQGEGGGDAAGAAGGKPLVSHFSTISAAWCSDFDSGAEEAAAGDLMAQDGSSNTDLDSDFDP